MELAVGPDVMNCLMVSEALSVGALEIKSRRNSEGLAGMSLGGLLHGLQILCARTQI